MQNAFEVIQTPYNVFVAVYSRKTQIFAVFLSKFTILKSGYMTLEISAGNKFSKFQKKVFEVSLLKIWSS